jgi:hypothetical protein
MHIKLPDGIFPSRYFFFFLLFSITVTAQDRCVSMEVLDKAFRLNPGLKSRFEAREAQLENVIRQRVASGKTMRTSEVVTIPVVFHVVLNRQSQVTDAQIRAQLDTINKDYAGLNAGRSRIPSYFADLAGETVIQFCLAQRTPDDKVSTGIERYTTSRTSFTYDVGKVSDDLKHSRTGGANAWDADRYLNIWICELTENTLGYATFPNTVGKDEEGVVIDYASLPGGTAVNYNQGKTLTHELGHFFGLYHIWGDDFGACSGSDLIADTPNQGNSTSALRTGIVTDNCTTTAPGIMYQNFMDYTPDAGLLMFTNMQVARMESVFRMSRSSLGASNACMPVNLKNKDASLKNIINPDQRICAGRFTPQVTLTNQGLETLTSVTISASLDDGNVVSVNWTGSLATYGETVVSLPPITAPEGTHVLDVFTSNPNGAADENTSNDQLSRNIIYYEPFDAPVNESFEGGFLPEGWDVVNQDGSNTWEKTTASAKTGSAAVRMMNLNYLSVGEKDYLRSPTVNIANTDSAFVSFQVAAATYSGATTQNTVWDTLQVLISTDCGKTYTSVYKKWGSSLITRSGATRTTFTPSPSEWRREEINISQFISSGNILVAFLNINGNQNDVYLDDINIRTVTVNPNLKEEGFLVTPNPTDGAVSVQFYPHPAGLKGVYIYNVSGQKVAERLITNGVVNTNIYDFDLKHASAGMYFVRAVFEDKVLVRKFVKIR